MYEQAIAPLRTRLDSGSKTFAAQDIRHLCQDDKESVLEFIRKLEALFVLHMVEIICLRR